jgi:hypothetical protein
MPFFMRTSSDAYPLLKEALEEERTRRQGAQVKEPPA